MKAPMAPDYYDRIFSQVDDYKAHYTHSRYFVLWTQVIQYLRSVQGPRILEIGCGPGQFANYLYDQGFRDYHGFDFSPGAVEAARKTVPLPFEVGDAMDKNSFRHDYNVAIVLEVLEHVTDDLGVLANLRKGTPVIFSLPTFDDEAHVRFFRSPQEIVNRYNELIDIQHMVMIHQWFVCLGVVRSAGPRRPVPCDSKDILAHVQRTLLGANLWADVT